MGQRRLTSSEHLAWLHENYQAVLGVSTDELGRAIPDCDGWRIETVIDHFARGAVAFGMFMTSPPNDNPMPRILASLPAHATGVDAIDLARRSVDDLLDLVATLDVQRPCPFVTGPGDVATWLWHASAETWVHRADVEHTLDRSVALDAHRGVDGLHWSALFRRLMGARLIGGPPRTIRCIARDAGEIVDIGDGPPEATVTGLGGDLILRLWNRQHGHLDGDGEAVDAWADLKVVSPLD